MRTRIDPAEPGDLTLVQGLLEASGLPSSDVTPEMLAHFLLARRGAEVVGVIGAEPYREVGLLRSAAVAPAHRGRGLGAELVTALERRARDLGVRRLYLLTTTAERFFAGLGYEALPRERAPEAIRGTTEYRELCASTSVCMSKTLDPGRTS